MIQLCGLDLFVQFHYLETTSTPGIRFTIPAFRRRIRDVSRAVTYSASSWSRNVMPRRIKEGRKNLGQPVKNRDLWEKHDLRSGEQCTVRIDRGQVYERLAVSSVDGVHGITIDCGSVFVGIGNSLNPLGCSCGTDEPSVLSSFSSQLMWDVPLWHAQNEKSKSPNVSLLLAMEVITWEVWGVSFWSPGEWGGRSLRIATQSLVFHGKLQDCSFRFIRND